MRGPAIPESDKSSGHYSFEIRLGDRGLDARTKVQQRLRATSHAQCLAPPARFIDTSTGMTALNQAYGVEMQQNGPRPAFANQTASNQSPAAFAPVSAGSNGVTMLLSAATAIDRS